MCLTYRAAARNSPLDLPYLFTKSREVLSEIHHHNDEGPHCERARGPQQGVQDSTVVIEVGQEHRVLLLTGVIVAGDVPVHLQMIGNVHDHGMHGRGVLLAAGHVDTLQGKTLMVTQS